MKIKDYFPDEIRDTQNWRKRKELSDSAKSFWDNDVSSIISADMSDISDCVRIAGVFYKNAMRDKQDYEKVMIALPHYLKNLNTPLQEYVLYWYVEPIIRTLKYIVHTQDELDRHNLVAKRKRRQKRLGIN